MVNLGDVLKTHGVAVRESIRVSMDVLVESYDSSTQTATVRLLVPESIRDLDGEREALATTSIEGCPVVWPYGGVRGITMGIEQGTRCLALVRTYSHDEVDAGGSGGELPASSRRMDLSDLVVIPGIAVGEQVDDASHADDGGIVLWMPADECVRVGSGTANKALALAESVDARLSQVQLWLNTHVHGPAGTVPVTPLDSLATTACNDLKVRS